MPAAVARTATLALTKATMPYAQAIARVGLRGALTAEAGLRCGLQTHAGHVTHRNLATDAARPFVEPMDALA
jgi:alanine dehydrogenase